MQDIESNLDIPLCHVVGEGVIVDVLMPFVGADHIIDLIILVLCMPFGAATPELGGAQHYFRAVIAHEIVITCNAPVLPDSMCHTWRDVYFEWAITLVNRVAPLRVIHLIRRV